jgi:hypothetical protein
MATVTMPDGAVVEMPDQLDPALGARLRAFHDSATKPPPQSTGSKIAEATIGPSEILGSSALNIPGAAINSVNDLARKLTGGAYNPGTIPSVPIGDSGRQLMGDIAGLPGVRNIIGADQAADAALKTAHPDLHAAIHTVGDEAGDALNILPAAGAVGEGATMLRSAAEAAEAAKAPLAAGDIEGALKASGYPSIPSKTAGATTGQKLGAGVVGESTLTGLQSLTSQAITDRFAQHEAGVAPDQELNYANVEAARKAGPAKVYDAAHAALPPSLTQDPQLTTALKGIGDTTSQLPSAPDVDDLKAHMLSQPDMTRDQLFANVQSAREKASKLFNATTPDAPALADAYTGIANAYEDFIGRQLDANPRSPVSLEDFQNARTAFAKNYAVQTALKGTSLDANKFATLQRKEPGLLTGPSQLIAEQANRYPLSTGFGPSTLADTGMGASGSIPGQLARRMGTAVGGGLGAGAGFLVHGGVGAGVGAGLGAGAGDLAMTGLQNLIRKALSGTPESGRAAASTALEDPRLADFFHPPEPPEKPPGPLELQPPPGQAFNPHQPQLATGGPTQRDFFGFGAGGMTADAPMTGPPPAVAGHPGELSLADVLSHGTEQRPVEGLSLAPMGHTPGEGIPFSVNADHAAGGLTLADATTPDSAPTLADRLTSSSRPITALRDMSLSKEMRALESERAHALRAREEGFEPEFEPEPIPLRAAGHEGEVSRRMADEPSGDMTLADLLAHAGPNTLSDLAHVASQGVPEDILQRSAKVFKPNPRDRPGQTALRRPSTLAELLDPGGG